MFSINLRFWLYITTIPIIYSQLLVIERNQTVLSIIDKTYPALISLNVNGFCITSKDIFGLIVGEWTDILYMLPVTGHVKTKIKS